MNDNQQPASADMQIPTQNDKINYWTSLMPKLGLALMIIGVLMSAGFSYQFKDTNLGLMIGFGFIIGGIQVLLLGSLFHALQPKFVSGSSAVPARQQVDRIHQ
ncbi:hypothetical protein [Paenibacillus sacheonensis]|uniref:Uncharacterized protein n=1 Tax=Paenibacillus sacheonensis TaxID=742054 RepID=A0A7X4YMZ4_9BACL|nr:hypothetical protein [Paenibacillus sacheonensis]MBM7564792.1 low temperature requirement protein LtrA [Paenibacillus sacheonensis]NBC69341.1 hypothetical protein [Paenibacillus sacheonensis]